MKCPVCQARMEVTDTRSGKDGQVARRRWCPKCMKAIFSIEEVVEPEKAKDILNNFYIDYRKGLKPNAS